MSCRKRCRRLQSVMLRRSHGIELVHFGGHYKFVSKESVYPYAQRLFASVKPVSLSNAAMETLAIIAYKQPITRTEIEEIRGVGCDHHAEEADRPRTCRRGGTHGHHRDGRSSIR